MAYSPQTWSDGNASYPVSAARMANIENGLQAAALVADQGVQLLTTTAKNALSPSTGWMVYDTTLSVFQFWNGSAWQSFAGDTGWIAISGYTNSWASNSGPGTSATVAAYRKTGNIVRLGGSIKTGSTATAAFTLPSGYRPTYLARFGTMNSGGTFSATQITVDTGGVVTPTWSSGSAPVSLDGVTFTID